MRLEKIFRYIVSGCMFMMIVLAGTVVVGGLILDDTSVQTATTLIVGSLFAIYGIILFLLGWSVRSLDQKLAGDSEATHAHIRSAFRRCVVMLLLTFGPLFLLLIFLAYNMVLVIGSGATPVG